MDKVYGQGRTRDSELKMGLGAVDCTTALNIPLCRDQHIQAFPTVRVYRKGKNPLDSNAPGGGPTKHYESYVGERSAEAVAAFAIKVLSELEEGTHMGTRGTDGNSDGKPDSKVREGARSGGWIGGWCGQEIPRSSAERVVRVCAIRESPKYLLRRHLTAAYSTHPPTRSAAAARPRVRHPGRRNGGARAGRAPFRPHQPRALPQHGQRQHEPRHRAPVVREPACGGAHERCRSRK